MKYTTKSANFLKAMVDTDGDLDCGNIKCSSCPIKKTLNGKECTAITAYETAKKLLDKAPTEIQIYLNL